MSAWTSVKERLPELRQIYREPAQYVLVIDGKGRMAVAYCDSRSGGGHMWVSAKPISTVTHWMPLPAPPILVPESEFKA